MLASADLEGWIDRLGGGHAEVVHPAEATWVVHSGDARVVVTVLPPVVILRIRVLAAPRDPRRRTELYEKLLTLNARDLVHGAYGLEEDHVVLTDTLDLDGLDYRALEASYEGMTLALATHSGVLTPYREK